MNKKTERYDVIVIGAGPAGMSSAVYASRANMSTLIIDGGIPGGQMANTDIIENYPGFPSITGLELSIKMFQQTKKFGAEYISDDVKKICDEGLYKTITTSKNVYEARAVIIATGAQHRLLGVAGEKRLQGRGVSYCAVCDGAFFSGKKVAVIGGGDSALEEALYLARLAEEVVIIHRRGEFRAQKILQERVFNCKKISIILNSVVKEIRGEELVESILLEKVDSKEESKLSVDGVFIYVGMEPVSSFVCGTDILDEKGYILTDDRMHTKIDGIYAAGDVRKKTFRQVVTATNDGCIAAQEAQYYVETLL